MKVQRDSLKRACAATLFLALPLIARAEGRVLWVTGHNELNLESGSPEGASEFRKTLEAAFPGWKIDPVRLVNLAVAPRDAVVVIAGPKRDLSEEDAARLRALLAGGARLLACVDPAIEHDRVDLARLRAVLQEAGADVRTERIVDREAPVAEAPAPMPRNAPVREERAVFVAHFTPSDHTILAALPLGARIVFSDACRVAAMSSDSDPYDVRELAATSPSAWSVSVGGARGPAGPVLVAGTRRSGQGRFVVAGDATFLTNGFAARTGVKGAPVAVAAIRWLAEGLQLTAAEREGPAPKASVRDEDRRPLVVIVAAAVAALLVAGNAVLGRRS